MNTNGKEVGVAPPAASVDSLTVSRTISAAGVLCFEDSCELVSIRGFNCLVPAWGERASFLSEEV